MLSVENVWDARRRSGREVGSADSEIPWLRKKARSRASGHVRYAAVRAEASLYLSINVGDSYS